MKVLVLTDNKILLKNFIEIIQEQSLFEKHYFGFYYSFNNHNPEELIAILNTIKPLNLNDYEEYIINNYDLLFSLHCKQIFPANLTKNKICINVHPGYNPFNRGWYPQVFSIINKKPIGATIHLMDEEIDHGTIIERKQVKIDSYDDSESLYKKTLKIETELLKANLSSILSGKIKTFEPEIEGNYNSKKDFKNLCKINLEDKVTFREAIDKLRAFTHGNFYNAYFIDEDNNKIYVQIILKKSDE